MRLIAFSLGILIFISLFTVLGATSSTFSADADFYNTARYDGYYDANGNLKAYANGTAANEKGYLAWAGAAFGGYKWVNETSSYIVYETDAGEDLPSPTVEFNLGTSLGLIGLIVGIIVLATIAGLRVFGTGTSDTSVKTIVLGTFALTLWGVFSILAMPTLTLVPLFGVIFYFGLTCMYTVGIFNSLSGGSSY